MQFQILTVDIDSGLLTERFHVSPHPVDRDRWWRDLVLMQDGIDGLLVENSLDLLLR